MTDNKPTGKLPTELISEKTFYTLGGASAAVLLTCWAINYVAVDVSWLSYKVYRLIGIILSEAFAVVIMFKTGKKSSMKWLFAFLNGLLIFVNASGLNIMTSSYIFNPKDSITLKQSGYFRFQKFHGDGYLQAGIFPLPRMINWWPDIKLIEQNQQLLQRTHVLDSVNNQLKVRLQNTDNAGIQAPYTPKDSLQALLSHLQSELSDKQKRIDQLTNSIQDKGDDLQKQLAECIKQGDRKNDSLLSCQSSHAILANDFRNLREDLKKCNGQLEQCNRDKGLLNNTIADLRNTINELNRRPGNTAGKQTTLTELLKQVCEKNSMLIYRLPGVSYTMTKDDSLRQQVFYKKINWAEFCRSFNSWSNPNRSVIK